MSQRLTLTFATVAALSAGTNYAFSSWAPQLASRLHLSSKQLNVVGAAGNAGVYLSGPLLGILVDKKGPRSALLIGAVALFTGCEYGRSAPFRLGADPCIADLALYAMYSGGEDGMYNVWGVCGLALAELATGEVSALLRAAPS